MLLGAVCAAGSAGAAVQPTVAKELVAIGRGVCVAETTQVYRPLHPNPPYKGVSIARDRVFGPDPLNRLDVFSPENSGGPLPVLMFVPGGAGNKQQGGPNGDVFYDNIMLWAVRNGMVGVNMQRRAGRAWDDPAKDIALVVKWVNNSIARYKGDPTRVFIWAHASGNIPVAAYIGHSEFWRHNEVGIRGVMFMSPPAFNILPAAPPLVPGGGLAACGQPNGRPNGALPADAPAGGRATKTALPPVRGRGFMQTDAATIFARSNLPGLIKSNVSFFVSVAELDPRNIIAFAEGFRDELCKAGRCPSYRVFKGHSHLSEVMSPDTADTSVTGPILEWMNSVK